VALMPVLQRYPDAPDWAAWLLRQIGVAHAVESVLMFLYVLKRGGSVVTAVCAHDAAAQQMWLRR
jgi:hypothetical protein